jgi:hypothetical protein
MKIAALTSCLFCAATVGIASDGLATDWPCFRGPRHDGVSVEPFAWPSGGPRVIWRKSVGFGRSAVAVARGHIYTLGNISRKADTVWCLDASTGKEIWKRDVRKINGRKLPRWGYSGSTLVQGKRLILTDAELPHDEKLSDFQPCEQCHVCARVRGAGAIGEDDKPGGSFDREACKSYRDFLLKRGHYCHSCLAECPRGKKRLPVPVEERRTVPLHLKTSGVQEALRAEWQEQKAGVGQA